MSMDTYLGGRLRNTSLPRSNGLLPLFEAVVNSIQSIDATGQGSSGGEIVVEVQRLEQSSFEIESTVRRGAPAQEPIMAFRIIDNGCGFDDENFRSFQTLDSAFKASQGCRGVGRLLWLKAFNSVTVDSVFVDPTGKFARRAFSFSAVNGVEEKAPATKTQSFGALRTEVSLDGFKVEYREKTPKTTKAIAHALFEHCLWYFVRDGGAPKLSVMDGSEVITLDDIYQEHMHSSAKRQQLTLKGTAFELLHLKLKGAAQKTSFIAWCAAGRVVKEESIVGKLPGLHGRLSDELGEFSYACFVTSEFLDQGVRAERIGFDIAEFSDGLFGDSELTFSEIRSAVLEAARSFLDHFLQLSRAAGKERVEAFVSKKAPRYRPIMARISDDTLSVDPTISDKDLDLFLHKHLADLEHDLLEQGHSIIGLGSEETADAYQARLAEYLAAADDLKKSDLANYVFHRKTILDILQHAIERQPNGKYAREELIHQIIMPMRKTSNEIPFDSANLWLIDERLAFHNYLASDKPISTMPIVENGDGKEPDLIALTVYDQPLLVSEGRRLPLGTIVVVEIKRPMRNDAGSGEDKDPIEQALGYLDRIRSGGAMTSTGRLIPESKDIPGFCYIVCDITSSVQKRCKLAQLKVTSDHQGYFGYNDNYQAYIEVCSYDRLLNGARERNRAFFDKLGLHA